MKLVNKLEIKVDKLDKCHVISDNDCPLGQLYDYACAFKSFIFQKMQESEAQAQPEVKAEESPKA